MARNRGRLSVVGIQINGTKRTPHPHLFRELRKRSGRHAGLARLLKASGEGGSDIRRVVELHRKHRTTTPTAR